MHISLKITKFFQQRKIFTILLSVYAFIMLNLMKHSEIRKCLDLGLREQTFVVVAFG